MKRHILAQLLLVSLAACRPGQPCPSCDDDEPSDLPEELPDLPCDGADLQNDNAHCGTCENQCNVKGSGDYEAGGCVAGVCGPTWYGQEWLEPDPLTCADVCGTTTGGALSCRANGCVGLTGFVCESVVGGGCEALGGSGPQLLDFSGTCDEPLPWPDVVFGGTRNVFCCCA